MSDAPQQETVYPAMAYLSLGCNIGDCRHNLAEALRLLDSREFIRVKKLSPVYATEPVGNPDQPDFLNIAAELSTELQPFDLLHACQAIERELGGRTGRVPLGPRTIDIDILMYEQVVMVHQELTLPHPGLLERAFMLVPLADIAPDAPLPGGGTVAAALQILQDRHHIQKQDTLCL